MTCRNGKNCYIKRLRHDAVLFYPKCTVVKCQSCCVENFGHERGRGRERTKKGRGGGGGGGRRGEWTDRLSGGRMDGLGKYHGFERFRPPMAGLGTAGG